MILKPFEDPRKSRASLTIPGAINILGPFQKYFLETTIFWSSILHVVPEGKKYELKGCSADLSSRTRETLTKALFGAGGLCSEEFGDC